MFERILLIRHQEFVWIKNLLSLVRSDDNIKNMCIKWVSGICPDSIIKDHPLIMDDKHTVGSLCWTVSVTKFVIQLDYKIKPHEYGLSYPLPLYS